MKQLIMAILMLSFVTGAFAQARSESRLDELKEELDEVKLELIAVDVKLGKNRITKGFGIGLTIVGAVVFWPALIPGLPLWIASPTKKWRRKQTKLEDRVTHLEDKIKDWRALHGDT